MKYIIMVLAVIACNSANAQIKNVKLQASGLTCSMCSNAINKSIRSLDFVDKVVSDIKSSTFQISFKQGSKIDFDKIKNKVEDAGFSVSRFIALVNFTGENISKDAHIKTAGSTLHFLNVESQKIIGDQEISLLDKGFVSSKIYNKNTGLTKMACYKTGIAETCCTKEGLVKGERIYHVTLVKG